MSTGDINGNIQRLVREAKSIKYPAEPDEVGLRLGDPVALLPILSFALLKFSRHVARFVVRSGFELQGKTDQRFIESSFKLFRDVLNVKTVLTPAQFFEQGFAERKVLLVCDVIGVCKKVHNEEVRQERLAALKATRQQDQAPNARGAVPRRTSPSPVVKVVRNHDDTEVHQVLGAQHLPNATDGAQSVYKTKKLVVGPAARSPSPSPGARAQSSGKGAPARPASSPLNVSRGAASDNLELTLGPHGGRGQLAAAGRTGVAGGTGRAGGAAATAAGASSSQQQQQPIHAWFLNPAFDEGEGGLGFSFGMSGAPDSSAWWRTAPSPQGHGASSGGAAGLSWQWAGAPEPGAAVPSSADPAQPQAHNLGNTGAGGRHGAGYGAHPEEPSIRPPTTAPPTASQQPNGGAGPGPKRGTPLLQRRELNEWSFSSFFGPGKVPGQQQQTQQHPLAHGGGEGGLVEGDEEQEDDDRAQRGDADALPGVGAAGAGYTGGSAAWPRPLDSSDLGAPAGDQDRYRGVEWRGSAASVHVVPQARTTAAQQHGATMRATEAVGGHAGASTALGDQGGQQPPRFGSPGRSAAQQGVALGGEASAHGGGAGAALTAQLARMEQETQQQLQQMRDRLAAVEEELAKSRVEAQQSRDVLQARVTVLEGRVRFLECELELCVKRGQGPSLTADAAGDVGRLGSSPERTGREQEAGEVASNGAGGASTSQQAAGAAAAQASSSSRPASAAGEMRASREAAVRPSFSQWEHAVAAPAQPSMYGIAAWPGRSEPNAGQAGPNDRLGYPLTAAAQRGSISSVQGQGSVGLGSGLAAGPGLLATSGLQPGGNAGSGMRASTGLSPMPQPAFSFQPSSLMQQVASAQLPPASIAEGAIHGGQGGAPETQPHSRVSRSLDSSVGQEGTNAASAGVPTWGHSSGAPATLGGSLDASLHGVGPAAAAGAVRQPLGAWRAAAGAGAAPRQGSSILDNLAGGLTGTTGPATLPPQPQPQQQLGSVGVARSSLDSHPQPNMHAGPSDVGRVAQAALPRVAPADSAVLDAQRPGSVAGRAGAVEGSAGAIVTPATGGGSYRSTDDLINSLYTRYTEAQDFLQTLRRR